MASETLKGIVTSSVFTAHYLPHGRTRLQQIQWLRKSGGRGDRASSC